MEKIVGDTIATNKIDYISKSTAILLVGGRSRRMNYQDKMNLRINDESFLERIARELLLFPNIAISANGEQMKSLNMEELQQKIMGKKDEKSDDSQRRENLYIIEDKFPDIGPLGGIYSVMEAVESEYYFVVSCDMPFIEKEVIQELYSHLESNDKAVVAVADGRKHPLFAIYRSDVKTHLLDVINREYYKVMKFCDEIDSKYVEIDASEALSNINTPKDLRILKKKVRKN